MQKIEETPQSDVPIASLVEVNGKFYKAFTNEVYSQKSHLKHAEILAINYTLEELKIMDFKNHKATLYSTLEPCCMCLSFSSLVRISKVIFYSYDLKFGGTARIYNQNSAFTKPEILCIEKKEVQIIMKNFFKTKRL